VALSPSVSEAADYWGRKWILVIFTTFGFVGSIVISRAHSIATVLVGFTIMSISFGSQPLLLAVVSEVLPRKYRTMAQASSNFTGVTGGIIGVIMGGALVRHGNAENYRIYFYVLAAFFAAAAIGCALCYNPPLRELQKSLTTAEKLRRLDWIGYALFIPGLILFCIALSWSRNPYQWSNAHVLATFVISIVLILGFLVYEWRFTTDGVLNHGLFRTRNFPLSLLLIFCEGLAFWACNNYLAFEVSVITGADLLIAGLHFVLVFAFGLLSSFSIGLISSRWKMLKIPIVLGFLLLLAFNVSMATIQPSTPFSAYWGVTIFAGLGLGIILPLVIVTAQMSTPPELISVTSGLMTAVRSVGGAVGLAINTALLNGALATNIPAKIAAATLPLGLPPTSLGPLIGALASQNQSALAHIPGVTPQVIGAAVGALKDAYGIGFRDAWIAACCFCALALFGKSLRFGKACRRLFLG
jgi:Major Facilitator Superfamily